MLLKHSHIKKCYDLVQSQITNFNLQVRHPRGDVRSVDDFKDFCKEQHAAFDDYELNLPAKGQPIFGSMIQTGDSYNIFLLSGLNRCWKRFVLCKEIFHIILDIDDKLDVFKNSNWSEQVEKTLFNIPNVTTTTEDCAAVEALAEICAMELLFPYEWRVNYISEGKSVDEIANIVLLPKALIEKFISKSIMESLDPSKFNTSN